MTHHAGRTSSSPDRRIAIVTGGAKGIGWATVETFVQARMIPVLFDRDEAALAAARERLTAQGAEHLTLAVDLTREADVDDAFAQVLARFGRLDVLVNNAGIASVGAMVETTMDEWRKIIEIDLLGVVRGCRLFIPGMLAAGHGQVLSTASFAGLAGAPGMMSYGVAKAAVVAMSEQLRAEMHGTGVRVGVICPAFFRTNLLDTAIASDKIKAKVVKLMDTAPDTLDSVADKVFAAAERGEFMIIPTKREPFRWWLKRFLPGVYFRMLQKLAKKRRDA